MFTAFWPEPPPAAGDMYTDDDAARPKESHTNQIAGVDEDEEDAEEEEDEEEQEEDDDEDQEKILSPQGVRCPIAATLPRFMTRSVLILPEVTGL